MNGELALVVVGSVAGVVFGVVLAGEGGGEAGVAPNQVWQVFDGLFDRDLRGRRL